MPHAPNSSPLRHARIAGVLYLAIIALGLFGEMGVRDSLLSSGNATATAQNIASSRRLWSAAIVGDLLMHVLDVPVIVIFYFLLRPVSRHLAILATLLNIVQTAVLAGNKLNLVVPLLLLQSKSVSGAFPPEQVHALISVFINAHGYGFAIGLIFFGFACLVRGWLIYRSGYVPRALGVLLAIAGVCYLVNSVSLLLFPAFAAVIFPAILMPAFIGELALCVWLLSRPTLPQKL
jgi:Domain of unknown function (DUF4386)